MRMKNAPKLFLTQLKRCIKVVIQSRKRENSIGPEHRALTVSDYRLVFWYCLKSILSTFSSRTEVMHPSKSLACDLDTAQLFQFQLNLEENKAISCIAKAVSKHKVVGWEGIEEMLRETLGEEEREGRLRPPGARVRLQPRSTLGATRLSCPWGCAKYAIQNLFTHTQLSPAGHPVVPEEQRRIELNDYTNTKRRCCSRRSYRFYRGSA